MDLYVAFWSMFLLSLGLISLGLGLFTAYFGAGKSKIIGTILTIIGIFVLLILYLMTIDHWGYGWDSDDVKDSFLGLVGILLGISASLALIVALMMVLKEKDEITEDVEESLRKAEESSEKKEETESPEADKDTSIDGGKSGEPEPEPAEDQEKVQPSDDGDTEKDKTGKKAARREDHIVALKSFVLALSMFFNKTNKAYGTNRDQIEQRLRNVALSLDKKLDVEAISKIFNSHEQKQIKEVGKIITEAEKYK